MDISYITKVRNRKNINEDNKIVLDKLSKLSSDAIKLKVAQDAIYWDLRQKLQQVEGNHERLQQNMVELQMQYENVSGQYQEEIRQRPETLNKLNSTREICDVLEDYSERLKQTLSRCKADQSSLCAAFQSSGQLVHDLKTSHQQAEEKSRQTIASLQERVKLHEEHHTRLMDLFHSSKQQLDRELNSAREQLSASQAAKEQLQMSLNERNNRLTYANSQLEKREEDITTLKREMTKMINEFNSQIEAAKNTLDLNEKNLKQATEDNEMLKKALSNQEEFCKSISEGNNLLEEKIAVFEEEKINALAEIEELKRDLEESRQSNDVSKSEIASLTGNIEKVNNELAEKDEIVRNLTLELDSLNDKIKELEDEKNNLAEAQKETIEQRDNADSRVRELIGEVTKLQISVEGIRTEFDDDRKSTELIIKELSEMIICQKQELEKKAWTATELMTELQNSNDAINKVQSALARCRKELDDEKERTKDIQVEMGVRIEHLEGKLEERETDISTQMNLIQELNKEKERLLSKMSEMQETIDNARDQLSAPHRPRQCLQAETDNAVMMPMPREEREKSPVIMPGAMFPPPGKAQKKDKRNVYAIFSDSSADDNTIDSDLVNRRFEAMSRGERLTPQPFSALKRRRVAANQDMPDAEIMRCPPQPPPQDTTKKFFKSQKRDAKTKGK